MLWKLFIEYTRFLKNEWISNFNFVIIEAFIFATDVDNIEKFLLLKITVIHLFTIKSFLIHDYGEYCLVIKIWHWFSISVEFLMLYFKLNF